MKLTKQAIMFALLMVIIGVQTASAALYLPDSSWAESVHDWQGTRTFVQGALTGYVDYTVYKQDYIGNTTEENAFVQSTDLTGDYIYAYQIFMDASQANSVKYFQLLTSESTALASAFADVTSIDDSNDGVDTFGADSNGKWYFEGGALVDGKHSFFLMFSSDEGPVAGRFQLATHDSIPVGGDTEGQVPEPATVAMLAIGGMSLMRAKRKKQ